MARVLEYHLPSDCSIAQAVDLQRELAKLLRARAAVTVTLHADAVRKIDAVGIQILYAFMCALGEKKIRCNGWIRRIACAPLSGCWACNTCSNYPEATPPQKCGVFEIDGVSIRLCF